MVNYPGRPHTYFMFSCMSGECDANELFGGDNSKSGPICPHCGSIRHVCPREICDICKEEVDDDFPETSYESHMEAHRLGLKKGPLRSQEHIID